MVNWNDPELQEHLGIASMNLVYVILGLYGWEYIRSSEIEIALLRRQLAFRWPLVSYITGRFSFLLSVVLLATQFSPFHTRFNCQGINTVIMLAINIAIGCSTTNLMIRTWMIWKTSYVLRLLLVLLSLGHWTVLTLFLTSARTSTRSGVCMLEYVNPAYADAIVMYGMAYDSLLLAFTIFGLWRMPSSSALWRTLVKQGVMYLFINLIANVILLVLNRLNLNPIMNGIFGTPAACICTLASSQAVRSLLRPKPNDPDNSPSSCKELTGQLVLPVFTSASGA
ncbi:hypothetical protein K503DRAFT_772911 [Rhizopogon vinicolor AM-OR11-026]|uniref:Uncharacterized protein n=1 Tax=Rhizopogon vinicolor AM-OR11-026 TaxID=1314800 RepID=A0A1B7MTX3_9AGAM|nr:hypothetical protein K503DRAFT_772911 [Rhizopogon vinicolor AM-OR11-026]